MKKFLVVFLTLALVFTFVACNTPADNGGASSSTPAASNPESTPSASTPESTPSASTPESSPSAPEFDPSVKSEGVMTHAEYMAAERYADVVVEAFVQGHQSWWDNKLTVYAQDLDGGYLFYNMTCTEEDSAKLVPGTRIKVTGTKDEWSGEIEIVDCTFEILEGTWIAEAEDLTALLGTDELAAKMNTLAAFKGLTVKSIEFQGGNPGKDIYLTVTLGENEYSFCVESYLTFPDSDVYTTVSALEAGDIIDVEAFVYWYNDAQPHITKIAVNG